MTLQEFFKENQKAAIALSGGIDSSYLLYAAVQAKADVTAYFVKSAFQPSFEQEDAERVAQAVGARLVVIEADILSQEMVVKNPKDRCYHCKKVVFGQILNAAKQDGYYLVLDGTNASDDASDRPGMQALIEMSVRSPLRECGLTKKEIRQLSKEAGLFHWSKPSYACLATRIPTDTRITQENLDMIAKAETVLLREGFSDIRVRLWHNAAKIQLPPDQMPRLLEKRELILEEINGFSDILLDLQGRISE